MPRELRLPLRPGLALLATGGAHYRLYVARVIAERELETLVRGLGGYVALSVALLATAWILGRGLEQAVASGVLIYHNPFELPLLAATFLLSAFLSVSSLVSVTRDRERGTLELLFYGPVDEPTYVAGKFAGQLAGYVAALPILLLCLALQALATGFVVTAALPLGLLASVIPAAEIVAFGLLLAVVAGRLRTAVVLLVAAYAAFLGIPVAYGLVSTMPIESPASPILPLRDSLAALDAVVDWVSPFSYLVRVLEFIALGTWPPVASALLAGLGHLTLTFAATALWLRRRGVRDRGG